jgi:malonate-semialdehyde dehydrogenase (acetylating)/methylmalonate-semialdehyde dehydrogenase
VALIDENEEKIARVLVEEMGKSLPDARAEVKRTLENCEVACGMPVLQQGDHLTGCSYDIDGQVLRLPVGVFTMIAPFNFPAMVPFWFLPYALATGNTYVVKASEQVPPDNAAHHRAYQSDRPATRSFQPRKRRSRPRRGLP